MTTVTVARTNTPRPQTKLIRWMLLVAVTATVLGIFGMHALHLHTTGMTQAASATAITGRDHASTEQPAQLAAACAGGHTAHAEQAGAPAATSVDQAAVPGHLGDANGMGDMVMLCAAMLAAVAGGFLALVALLQRVSRLWAILRPAVTRCITACVQPTGTGPPSVWEFSVIRC